MDQKQLESIASALTADSKGLLAADESFPTIMKRFDAIGVESTEETRGAYRELLFTTPGIEQFLSGIILFDETIRQTTHDGVPLIEVIERKGIVPGIKVDLGTRGLPFFPGAKITEGLDRLHDRLVEYRDLGAQFAKWRAVITIGDGIPTQYCIEANAQICAHYAAMCQELDLLPIVEPEVLMDGDHDLRRCEEVTESVQSAVFWELRKQRVLLEGMLLKPNMVVPGKKYPVQIPSTEVAAETIRCLRRTVPAAVPGIMFLSGGQSSEQAIENLSAINSLGTQPWALGFSFSRALQEPVMKIWSGKAENTAEAQRKFYELAERSSKALSGTFSEQQRQAA
jgi:fructose-bisphosphate aldolase class I